MFDYKFTWVVGGSDKGWTFHYRPEHLPLSAEMSSLLAFLQLRPFNECPEYDFAECFSGVPGTVGYVSFNKYSVEHIAEMLIKKLKA